MTEPKQSATKQSTPITDAAAFYSGDVGDEVVTADVARQLECKLEAERRQYVQCSEALNRALLSETATHTDHPSRHWDRTCPACVNSAPSAGATTIEALHEETLRLNTEIGSLLSDALSGQERRYRTEGGYIRWGLVEKDIKKKITAFALAQFAANCAEGDQK